jgi:tetratricopeptide (TPR) repeat protein
MDEAIEEYKEAIRLNPDYAVAHNNLGLAYDTLGRTDEAIEEFLNPALPMPIITWAPPMPSRGGWTRP